jgi:moderate conductance mechanosensitive channel
MNSLSTWLTDLEAWHAPAAAAARIVLILAGTWIAQRLASPLIRTLRERSAAKMTGAEKVRRAETLGPVFRYLTTVAIGLMGGVLVLAECGVSVAPILGAAGIEIPFPHMTLFAGAGMDGRAPAFHVARTQA